MRKYAITIICLLLLITTSCQVVPTSGDKSSDAASAQNFVPQSIPGYNSSDTNSITDSLSAAGVSLSVITGNLPLAGIIAKLDNMVTCYKGVGAVAARVYTEPNPALTSIPKVGASPPCSRRSAKTFLQIWQPSPQTQTLSRCSSPP